ncbi:hypothetical protein D3C76_420790 [compost metagenome]
MRIILSRKGFDSSAGGCPSPILPDGRLLSLPIPDPASRIAYRDIRFDGVEVGELVAQLTRDPEHPGHPAHLDPDLRPDALPRLPGWRLLLGQSGSAQGHLRNELVRPGDVFLFFGLFRPVENTPHGWRFQAAAAPRQIIWGWLQIGEIHKVDELGAAQLSWARYHPHFAYGKDPANTLYLAGERLVLDGRAREIPGAGVFSHLSENLLLTAPQARLPSQWRLPRWFHPQEGRSRLSYHSDAQRWSLDETGCLLQSARRGQEFVFDATGIPQAVDWIEGLILG